MQLIKIEELNEWINGYIIAHILLMCHETDISLQQIIIL